MSSDTSLQIFRCRKSLVQEYDCQVCKNVFFNKEKMICFDKCLSDELFYLWDKGIITTGSCCGGHLNSNRDKSYIGVLPKYIPLMKEMGYEVRFNPNRPNSEDSFIPKTNFK